MLTAFATLAIFTVVAVLLLVFLIVLMIVGLTFVSITLDDVKRERKHLVKR